MFSSHWRRIQRAALPNADGVVVRAAFTNSQFDREGVRAYALASWMRWYGRSAKEERRWLLDGAAQWMVARDLPLQQEKMALRAAFAVHLLQARQRDAGGAVRQWLTVREELGTCLSDALAWRMVSSLAQQMGEQRFQARSRSVLAVRPPDARGPRFSNPASRSCWPRPRRRTRRCWPSSWTPVLMPFGARSFPERFDALSNELSVIQIVFGFALGSTLLVREIDDGTLNFLDGLPLERSAIFMAKIKAAMLVLTSLPLGTLLLTVALHLATRESLDHALQPFLLLTFFGLSILVTAVGLTAGMLLGFLRYLSWLGSPAPSMTTSSIRWARSFSTAS
ncbi:MAG: hypothetical protein JWR65_3167 [Massilia sp.]|nr:hypothetical protein [Massilia sp.]